MFRKILILKSVVYFPGILSSLISNALLFSVNKESWEKFEDQKTTLTQVDEMLHGLRPELIKGFLGIERKQSESINHQPQ